MNKNACPRLRQCLADRLAPEGRFGLQLTIGATVALVAAAVFAGIAAAVSAYNGITLLDARVAQWFHFHTHAALTDVMLIFTHLHDGIGVLMMAVLLALYFRFKKARHWQLTLALAVPGGMLLNVLLKHAFQRARPSFGDPLLALSTYSFPSGHALGATVFYGVLAAYLCAGRTARARAAIVAAAAGMIALVGLSRLYLGAHYLSDVLAGVAEGSAWLAICMTVSATSRRGADPA